MKSIEMFQRLLKKRKNSPEPVNDVTQAYSPAQEDSDHACIVFAPKQRRPSEETGHRNLVRTNSKAFASVASLNQVDFKLLQDTWQNLCADDASDVLTEICLPIASELRTLSSAYPRRRADNRALFSNALLVKSELDFFINQFCDQSKPRETLKMELRSLGATLARVRKTGPGPQTTRPPVDLKFWFSFATAMLKLAGRKQVSTESQQQRSQTAWRILVTYFVVQLRIGYDSEALKQN